MPAMTVRKERKSAAAIEDSRFVVIDTELTGLDERRDSLVSIGAVRMQGGRIGMGDTFYRMINPRRSLTSESVLIHGITPSEVETKPAVDVVLREFLEYCGDDIIVGFCVSIDMGFLGREAERLFGHAVGNPAIDIQRVFEWLLGRGFFPGGAGVGLPRRYQLYDIARYFDIEVNGAHNALIDAFITAQIFQRFIPAVVRAGIKRSEEFVGISRKFKGGERQHYFSGMFGF